MKTSNERKVRLSMKTPAYVRSVVPISEMTPVVRKRKMNWLLSDGYIPATACGNVTRKNALTGGRPSDLAASRCPVETLS